MKDKTLVGGIVVMVVGALLIGVVWFLFLKPTVTPSVPIEAIPLEIEGGNYTIFEITSAESEVAFSLDEVLRGLPTTAIGRSREMAGQIAVDFDDPQATQIGPVLINARTLLTDNQFRNNAIQNFILNTEVHEFITFRPTQISGLPAAFTLDEPIALQIEGELTIREITQPVIFTSTVTSNGRSELAGSAAAQIMRTDFNLQIPNAPGVANVSETVTLTIDFVAAPLE